MARHVEAGSGHGACLVRIAGLVLAAGLSAGAKLAAAADAGPAFAWPHGARAAVSLAYDDALDSQLDHALPALDRHGLKASFYLQLSNPAVARRMEEWRAAARRGHELGNHSLFHQCARSKPGRDWVEAHRNLDITSVAQMRDQVLLANTMLSAIDGRQERSYTAPCGDSVAAGRDYLSVSTQAHEELLRFLADNRGLVWTDSFIAIMKHVRQQQARQPAGWTLAWSDEFDGAQHDRSKWVVETGGHCWGNKELQHYTGRPENLRVEGGMLVIEARRERHGDNDYTSARIKTAGLMEQMHGRFEARIKVPKGQGIWPAFWMLGANIRQAGWPRAGEIDIMENIGKEPAIVHGTLHGPGYSGDKAFGSPSPLASGVYADDFHVFAVEWERGEIRWYRDGILYHTARPDLVEGDWVFEHPFFVLLNLAVGGLWPGYPDSTTTLPQRMLVDYVRVYRRAPAQ
jgi:beta-glucanase (GH16 family)